MRSSADELDLIVIADTHYSSGSKPDGAARTDLGLELLQRVLRRASIQGETDAVVLLGDFINDCNATGAADDLSAIRDIVARCAAPTIIVPGNHDGDPGRTLILFGDKPGAHRIKNFVLFSIADHYGPDNRCHRANADLDALRLCRASNPDLTLIALQHSPVYPPIESDYPYNIEDAASVMRAYEEAGVVLSISGHYHRSLPPSRKGGVTYVTCPALCIAPFTTLRVKVRGSSITVSEECLMLDETIPLCDVHVHTEFAYCSSGITAKVAIERARLLGVSKMSLTEHADQLYLSREDFKSGRIIEDPDLPRRMRDAGRDRFPAFRAFAGALRSPSVRIGLEIECNSRFEPIVLDEDRNDWDVLLGAVHWMTDEMKSRAGSVEGCFMKLNEALMNAGIHVLAHPFRYFVRNRLQTPVELYRPLARLLAERGVAAEINFHTNVPDPKFFAICMEEGARIALGSDSHQPDEVGELGLHLELLRGIGASDDDLRRALFQL